MTVAKKDEKQVEGKPKRPETVKAYCVRGFRVEGGAVAIGDIVECSFADFRRLEHYGKVIDAKDAPKPEKKGGKKAE